MPLICNYVFFSCSEFERKTEKELAQEKFGDVPLVEYKPSPNPDKNAYFGDLHVHTENSLMPIPLELPPLLLMLTNLLKEKL